MTGAEWVTTHDENCTPVITSGASAVKRPAVTRETPPEEEVGDEAS